MKAFNKKHKPKHFHTKRKYRRIVNCEKIIVNKHVPTDFIMFLDLEYLGYDQGIGVIISQSTYDKLLRIAKQRQHILYDNIAKEM